MRKKKARPGLHAKQQIDSELAIMPCCDNDEKHICNFLSVTVNVVDFGDVGSYNRLLSASLLVFCVHHISLFFTAMFSAFL